MLYWTQTAQPQMCFFSFFLFGKCVLNVPPTLKCDFVKVILDIMEYNKQSCVAQSN